MVHSDCHSRLHLRAPLGGPKYSEFEIEPGKPLIPKQATGSLESRQRFGGVPKWSNGMRCKRIGSAFAGSNPASPTVASENPVKPTKYERKLGQGGQAIVNQNAD